MLVPGAKFKDKRWDMNHKEDYYNKPLLHRTLEELKGFSKKELGQFLL